MKPLGATTCRGVSMIELIVALSILAIISTLALPSFTGMIQNARVRTAADGIQNGLQLARAEALRRNTLVRFVMGAGAGWTVQLTDGTVIQTRPAGEGGGSVQVTTTGGTSTVTYNGFGRVTDLSPLTQVAVSLGSARTLNVTIGAGGQVKLCDPSISDANDVRKC